MQLKFVNQKQAKPAKRVRTKTVLQMEALECGAAALGIVLGTYGRFVPLEQLRIECGVSRNGSTALNIVKAGRKYGLNPRAFKKEPADLRMMKGPMIIHWNFNHFLVLEGFGREKVYLNDPASGPRTVSKEEFDQTYTGIVITFEPAEDFVKEADDRSLFRAIRQRLDGSKSAMIFICIAGLLMVLPGLVIPTFTRVFIDQVLVAKMSHWMIPLLLGMLATGILRGVLTHLQKMYLLRLETKMALETSGHFLRHVLRLPISFFHQRYAGEIASRVHINDRIAQMLSGQLTAALLDLLMIVFYMLLMLQYSVVLTGIGLIIAMCNLVYLRFVSRSRVDTNQKFLQDDGEMQGMAMGGIQMIETLKASGEESDFFAKWAGWKSKLNQMQQRLGVSGQFLHTIPTFLTMLSSTLVLIVGGLYVLQGSFTIGMLIAFQSLMASFLEPINRMISLGTTLQEVKGSMIRLEDVYRYPSGTSAQMSEATDDSFHAKLTGEVSLRQITFGYSPLDPPLIQDFNLTVKPGSRIAIVGGSGSGKSTIAKLIAGIYEPVSGEIRFDGVPRQQIPRSILTNSLAVVDQDIQMFEGTVRDNVSLWDETITEEQLIAACKDAAIHDEITERPLGYLHVVQESGRNFSGGQLQRLEIARALAIEPSILVLDEATSALDPATEAWVDASLRRRGCTCIIVAHRLSTIRDADEIIVMEKGKVVQRGVHDDMKMIDGPYARLIAAY